MSGYGNRFDPAGAGTRDGVVPAPGAIDGATHYLLANGTWGIPGSVQPGPAPPAPGPALNQWACNAAGFLTYTVTQALVKKAVDWLPVSWLGDVAGGIVAGLVDTLLPEIAFIDGTINDIIFTWVSEHVAAYAAQFATSLIDDALWAKIHCKLYDAILSLPGDLATAINNAATQIASLTGYPSGVLAGIEYLLEHLGVTSVLGLPLTAFTRQYNCSTCATTGIGPVKPLLQQSFDLTVSDGSATDSYVDAITFVGAEVSGTSPRATVTVPGLAVQRDGSAVATRRVLNFRTGTDQTLSVADDPANSRINVQIDVPVPRDVVIMLDGAVYPPVPLFDETGQNWIYTG